MHTPAGIPTHRVVVGEAIDPKIERRGRRYIFIYLCPCGIRVPNALRYYLGDLTASDVVLVPVVRVILSITWLCPPVLRVHSSARIP